MPIARLSHIGICVSELGRSLHFYRDLLGFGVVSDLNVEGEEIDRLLEIDGVKLKAVYLRRDGTTIELLEFAAPGHTGAGTPRPMNALGLTHLSLRVDDLTATVQTLRREGVAVIDRTSITNPALGSAAVFVTDPDGTRIELVEMRRDPAVGR